MEKINGRWLLLTIGILLLCNNFIQAQTLRIEISLSKTTYLQGEPIWLDAVVTNISPDTVRMWGLCLSCRYGFIVEVKNEKNRILPYKAPVREFILGHGFIINPKETYYECVDLVESFSQELSLTKFFFTTLDPGLYWVKAKYGVRKEDVIESNEIKFEVQSPKGEEAKAYQLLKDAHRFFDSGKDTLMKQSLHQLLTQFPKSVYAEKACQLLFRRKELLEKFPDSGFTQTSLDVLTDRMNKEKKEEFLRKIIKEHPGTRSAKFAEQMFRLGY